MIIEKKVNLGEVFNIELEGNITTGYSWVLAKLPSNIFLLNEQYIVNPHARGMVGVGGTKTFTFKVMGSSVEGEILVFKEMRPWENTGIKDKIFKVDVTSKISYEYITDYFVGNNVMPEEQYLVINSKEEFDKWFHPAAVMFNKQRWIKEDDFDNNYIIAVIEQAEKNMSNFMLEDLEITKDTLEIKYNLEKNPIDCTVRYAEILLVEKSSYKNVTFIENGTKKEMIPV